MKPKKISLNMEMNGEKGKEHAWICIKLNSHLSYFYSVDMICESADLNRKEFLVS